MDFKFNDSEIRATGQGSFVIITREAQVKPEDMIQIIDEAGHETNFTLDKFIEIFDNQGLSGFAA